MTYRHRRRRRGDESGKNPRRTGLGGISAAKKGNREARRYSLAARAGAGGRGSLLATTVGLLLIGRRPALRALPILFDSTKSAMRGTISARKREPLNTP